MQGARYFYCRGIAIPLYTQGVKWPLMLTFDLIAK